MLCFGLATKVRSVWCKLCVFGLEYPFLSYLVFKKTPNFFLNYVRCAFLKILLHHFSCSNYTVLQTLTQISNPYCVSSPIDLICRIEFTAYGISLFCPFWSVFEHIVFFSLAHINTFQWRKSYLEKRSGEPSHIIKIT